MTADEQGHVQTRQEVHGVDFSGAKDAGKKIWIASGQIKGRDLHIICCRPAKVLPHSGSDLKAALKALRHFIAEQRSSAIGIDFPFGLPQSLVKETSWEAFVAAMRCYSSPEEFKKKCFERAGGRELKRQTDVDAKTPFSPYSLRLYKQTYFGIRDVLGPLLEEREICALPMQSPVDDRPWVIEICPAS